MYTHRAQTTYSQELLLKSIYNASFEGTCSSLVSKYCLEITLLRTGKTDYWQSITVRQEQTFLAFAIFQEMQKKKKFEEEIASSLCWRECFAWKLLDLFVQNLSLKVWTYANSDSCRFNVVCILNKTQIQPQSFFFLKGLITRGMTVTYTLAAGTRGPVSKLQIYNCALGPADDLAFYVYFLKARLFLVPLPFFEVN